MDAINTPTGKEPPDRLDLGKRYFRIIMKYGKLRA
jgi:hypothetical protein